MRRLSPRFWSRVRTVNWVLGALGMGVWLGHWFFSTSTLTHGISGPRPSRTVTEQSPIAKSREPGRLQARVGNQPENYPRHTVNYLAFTGDDRTLIGDGSNINGLGSLGELHGWDVASGKKLWTSVTPGPVDQHSTHSTLMPDKSTVATVHFQPNFTPGKPGEPFRNKPFHTLILMFLDARTGGLQHSKEIIWEGEPENVVSIDAAPDGKSVAVASADRIVVWKGEKGNPSYGFSTLRQPADRQYLPISRAQFTADGKHLVVLSADWDVPTGPNTNKNFFTGADVWDARTGARVRSFGEQTAPRRGGTKFHHSALMAALSQDRRHVVTFSLKTHQFVLWDIASGKRLVESPSVGERPLMGSSNLKFIANRGDTVSVNLVETGEGMTPSVSVVYWDTAANQLRRAASADAWGPAHVAAISNDGRLAATPSEWRAKHIALLRDARTGHQIRVLKGSAGP